MKINEPICHVTCVRKEWTYNEILLNSHLVNWLLPLCNTTTLSINKITGQQVQNLTQANKNARHFLWEHTVQSVVMTSKRLQSFLIVFNWLYTWSFASHWQLPYILLFTWQFTNLHAWLFAFLPATGYMSAHSRVMTYSPALGLRQLGITMNIANLSKAREGTLYSAFQSIPWNTLCSSLATPLTCEQW